ncbi:hypothetical protein RYD26_12175 [Pasteurellaceae bacterium LIM206]|nr:hypothetical protein [Pasteurellaceae bacterium LIM206]
MDTKNILRNLVENFYLTQKKKINKLRYVDVPQEIKNKNISGELLEYFQHIDLKDSCSFKNKFFNIELISVDSESRDLEYLGLDHFEKWDT